MTTKRKIQIDITAANEAMPHLQRVQMEMKKIAAQQEAAAVKAEAQRRMGGGGGIGGGSRSAKSEAEALGLAGENSLVALAKGGGALFIANEIGRALQKIPEVMDRWRDIVTTGGTQLEAFAEALANAVPVVGELARGFQSVMLKIGSKGFTAAKDMFAPSDFFMQTGLSIMGGKAKDEEDLVAAQTKADEERKANRAALMKEARRSQIQQDAQRGADAADEAMRLSAEQDDFKRRVMKAAIERDKANAKIDSAESAGRTSLDPNDSAGLATFKQNIDKQRDQVYQEWRKTLGDIQADSDRYAAQSAAQAEVTVKRWQAEAAAEMQRGMADANRMAGLQNNLAAAVFEAARVAGASPAMDVLSPRQATAPGDEDRFGIGLAASAREQAAKADAAAKAQLEKAEQVRLEMAKVAELLTRLTAERVVLIAAELGRGGGISR